MRKVISRKPKFAIAAVIIGLGVYLAVMGLPRASRRKSTSPGVTPAAKRANVLSARSLGNFERLPGTPFLMAPIHSEPGRSSRSESYSYSSSSNGYFPVHNQVFFNVDDQSFHRLLPTNDSLIQETERFTEDGEVIAAQHVAMRAKGPVKVRWLLFDVVKQDTDHDGDLDGMDLHTLAVSDAGGVGYTELIGGIQERYGRELRAPDTLVVIYKSGGLKRVSVIDLPGRAVTSTALLPDLGPDVE